MRLLVTIPTLAGRGFTYVAYLDDSGSCFPFPAEENLNALRMQRGLCPPQAISERARISWPAAPGKAITGISEVRKKFRSGPYPSFPLGDDLADAARHWIGVDHGLDCGAAVCFIGPGECPSGPECSFARAGP